MGWALIEAEIEAGVVFPPHLQGWQGTVHGGLLGMDFLSRVEYSIDYDQSVIRWKLRSR